MTRRRQKQRRDKLFAADPKCFWCGVNLIEEEGHDNSVTLDHLFGKLDPRRLDPRYKNETVLACYRCNKIHGRKDEIAAKSFKS